jgi:NAD(P)-dependent dehydrogenase (short-subunit alcohol dehydrogenase family)
MKLQGKVAVVTGGGGGIGAAICRALADEGAPVAVCDARRDAAETVAAGIRARGGHAAAWLFDVADRAAVEKAADAIEGSLGALEIWVNNAGVSRIVPFLECSDETWDLTLSVNLKGAFVGCQARKRNMRPEDVRPYMESRIPMGRLCTPEDIARAVVFLASDDAAYITGQALNLAGGAEMH